MPQQIIYLLYRTALAAAFPFLLLYVLIRGLRDWRYFRHGRERWGFLPPSFHRTAQQTIWLHAVSVGEVLSAVGLIRSLRDRYPEAPMFVSCMTVAGRAVAEEKLAGLVDGVFYLPWDYAGAVRRVIRHIRPAVLVVLETEIWPNLYREVKRAGVGLLIVNGRISVKAFPSYQRVRPVIAAALQWPDEILAQSSRDARHYRELGAPGERVIEAGNLKYDFAPPKDPPDAIRNWLAKTGDGPLWVAASTTGPMAEGEPDEDELVIAAYEHLRRQMPGLRLVLAPRKPERFDAVAAIIQLRGMSFIRRTQLPGDAPVLLLDSLGELGSLFPAATVVFVGGSLVSRGGHNILEPALCGAPVVVGPHMENFQEIFDRFVSEQAVSVITPDELVPTLHRLLTAPAERLALARGGQQTAEAERGAVARAVAAVGGRLEAVVPVNPRPFSTLLRPLTFLWRWGGQRKRQWDLGNQQRLPAPVISVGNITAGGTGKTPVVLWLTEWLAQQGHRPGVLTRGYRRIEKQDVILPRGSAASVDTTGDEAQVILQAGHAALGISADRASAGRALIKQDLTDFLVLDDGFQHARLHRDLDIVLIDALDPFGGGDLLPAGRLREPLKALSRADVLIITRAPHSWRMTALERILRQHNPAAPIHYARVEPLGWVSLATGEPSSLPAGELAAICGLANPESFWQSLRTLGIRPASRRAFPDHHRYTMADLADLSGASAILTTGKDAVKLRALNPGLPVIWLRIGLSLEDEAAFKFWLQSKLQVAKSTARR